MPAEARNAAKRPRTPLPLLLAPLPLPRPGVLGTAAAAGLSAIPDFSNATNSSVAKSHKNKHWIWINPNRKDEVATLKKRYKAFYDAGIRGILFEADSEMHYTEAKNAGLEAHRWNWTMNRGDVLKQHPEWSAISRTGDSCATKPPYVGYYKWLCPSKPEVQDFLKNGFFQKNK